MGKETQLLEAAAAGNRKTVEVSGCVGGCTATSDQIPLSLSTRRVTRSSVIVAGYDSRFLSFGEKLLVNSVSVLNTLRAMGYTKYS